VAVLSLLANGGFVAYLMHREAEEHLASGDPDEPGANKARPTNTGFPIAKDEKKLNPDLAQSYGVETGRAQARQWQERVTVYGRIVPNPRATYEVRSAFAGTLLAGDKPWPQVGQTMKPGQALGSVAVRVTPQERIELQNKLAEALLKEKGAKEIVVLRQGVVTRLEKASSAVIGQRELDEAKVQLSEAQTQLGTAEAAVQIWRKTLDDIDQLQEKGSEVWRRPLTVPVEPNTGSLEVTELAAQPGSAIEAGGLVVRLVDYSRLLVRLDLPAEMAATGPPQEVRLKPLARGSDAVGHGGEIDVADEAITATLVGPASQVDGSSQLVGFLYLVRTDPKAGQSRWRPGLFVSARLPATQGPPREVVSVPTSAVLYHQGRALVYIVEKEQYVRREVQVLSIEGDRCFLEPRKESFANPSPPNSDISVDDVVVVRNPQVLLSNEFRRDVDD
jgi:hypothetical protein